MAVYTNPTGTSGATLTTGELVGSTIAAIEKTGEDAYARDLTLKTDASATDLTVTAGAYLKVSANAVVDGLTFTNGGATPTVRVSNGGTVKNVVTNGTVSLYPYGGKIENVTANTGCYLNVFYNGVVDGGTFSGARLQVGSAAGTPGGTIRNVTILNAAGDGANQVQRTRSYYPGSGDYNYGWEEWLTRVSEASDRVSAARWLNNRITQYVNSCEKETMDFAECVRTIGNERKDGE